MRIGTRLFIPQLIASLLLVSVAPAFSAVRILEAQDVLRDHLTTRQGTLYLSVDGREWPLIDDPSSPLISQLGDGAFHPMDAQEVRAAVRAMGPGLLPADATVIILPYPRQAPVESSCEGLVVFLSPGIREVSREHIHATVAHELGHLIQHARLPEGSAAWSEYIRLRALTDPHRFYATAAHRDRPREIFAEDFRFLFGGELANYSGAIENGDLPLPDTVPGLESWMRGVLRRSVLRADAPADPVSLPNPFSLAGHALLEIRFAAQPGSSAATAAHAQVFDVSGRLVQTLSSRRHSSEGGPIFSWDGRDSGDHSIGDGVYFVRWSEQPTAGTARVLVRR